MGTVINATPIYQPIKDTVKTTGLSEFYLRKLLKAGLLPHIKSGTKVLVNVPKLLAQLENSNIDSTDAE